MTNISDKYSYKKLFLYQKAKKLTLLIYYLTSKYPKSEINILVPQMRRAVISVLANIVEGYSKESSAEYPRFLSISIGSLTELEVYLDLSFELGYIKEDELAKVELLVSETKRLLCGSRKKVKANIKRV